jgi:hypothetical protein
MSGNSHKIVRLDHDSTLRDGLNRRNVPAVPKGETISIAAEDATGTRLEGLGLQVPDVAVLPRNFESAATPEDFVFEESTSMIVALGRRAGVMVTVPGPSEYRTIHEKDAEIIAPVLQFSHQFLMEGGAVLAVAFLQELGRHVRKRWGGRNRDRHAILEIAVTKGRSSKRLTYSGPPEELAQIVEAAQGLFNGED